MAAPNQQSNPKDTDKSSSNPGAIEVHLFTDGACSGNPGPGGWAYLLRHLPTGTDSEGSGGQEVATNNSMELMAVVEGLGRLKRSCHVELFTDSVYVGKGLTEWMPKWKQNNWQRKEKGQPAPVKNVELWKQLDELNEKHTIKYTRVAGHSGHPENDRVDQLAVDAYQEFLAK